MDKIIIDCIGCDKKLRIPRGHESLEVKCPACSSSWIWSARLGKVGSHGFDDYLAGLLLTETALAKREIFSMKETYKEVFDFLPGLHKSVDELVALDGVLVNVDAIVSEVKDVLGVHSQWIAKYKILSSELTKQSALRDWLTYAKNYSHSTAFKTMIASKHKGSPFYDSFDLAIEESKRQLKEHEQEAKRLDDIKRQHLHEEKMRADELVNIIREKDSHISGLSGEVNSLKGALSNVRGDMKSVFWYLCVSFVVGFVGLYALSRNSWLAAILIVSVGCFAAALDTSGVKKL